MKLYAITKGRYSSYGICALTASKEKAEKLAKIYSDKYEKAFVEEYDDGIGERIGVYYTTDGKGNCPEVCDFAGSSELGVHADRDGIIYGVTVFARDEKHAQKIARDMIAQYKAEKANL